MHEICASDVSSVIYAYNAEEEHSQNDDKGKTSEL